MSSTLFVDASSQTMCSINAHFQSIEILPTKSPETIWDGNNVGQHEVSDTLSNTEDIAVSKEYEEEYSIKVKKEEIQRRLHPKTKEDFALLYSEMEIWRAEQNDFNSKKKRLLDETKILRKIHALRQNAVKNWRKKKMLKLLESSTQPKLWTLKNGDVIEVETPCTIRAEKLTILYEKLRNENNRKGEEDSYGFFVDIT